VGLSDLLLVRRLRRGDRTACDELIERYHAKVYGYLRRLGAAGPLAEDLTQETYAKAWTSIAALREAASLRCWLLAIARNEYFQWARGRSMEREVAVDPPETAAAGPDPEATAALQERDRLVHLAVGRLEPGLRELVTLHYAQGLSLKEVGAVLGIPAGTVKSRVHRALDLLRAMLEPLEADHGQKRDRAAIADRR
jgi:RNA polymerase sigma-70 factor, ECF subfamily